MLFRRMYGCCFVFRKNLLIPSKFNAFDKIAVEEGVKNQNRQGKDHDIVPEAEELPHCRMYCQREYCPCHPLIKISRFL